jgi:hypothetical protein
MKMQNKSWRWKQRVSDTQAKLSSFPEGKPGEAREKQILCCETYQGKKERPAHARPGVYQASFEQQARTYHRQIHAISTSSKNAISGQSERAIVAREKNSLRDTHHARTALLTLLMNVLSKILHKTAYIRHLGTMLALWVPTPG